MSRKPNKIETPALDVAEAEARRFLARTAELRRALAKAEPWGDLPVTCTYAPRENAAMKRASLDLTRALATVRRPGA